MIRIMAFLFLGAVVIGPPVASTVLVMEDLQRIRDLENETRQILPKFIADLQMLQKDPPFPVWSRQRNAEPLFSMWVSWLGQGLAPLETPSHKALRALFEKYPNAIKDEKYLAAMANDPLFAQIDTRWMENLTNYDHWRLSSHPKVHEQLASAKNLNSISRIGVFASLPTPDFTELRKFAIVHFLKMHQRGQPVEALTAFRKAAELSYTTGSLVGSMIALTMLRYEANLVVYARPPAWPMINPATLEAFKRVSWTWTGMLKTPWLTEAPPELADYMIPQLGACSSAGEAAVGWLAFSDFFEPRVPLEVDFSAPLARARVTQEKLLEICDQREMALFGDRSPASANPLFNYDLAPATGTDGVPKATLPNPARIPYVRRVIGTKLLTISMPNYLRYYKEEAL